MLSKKEIQKTFSKINTIKLHKSKFYIQAIFKKCAIMNNIKKSYELLELLKYEIKGGVLTVTNTNCQNVFVLLNNTTFLHLLINGKKILSFRLNCFDGPAFVFLKDGVPRNYQYYIDNIEFGQYESENDQAIFYDINGQSQYYKNLFELELAFRQVAKNIKIKKFLLFDDNNRV